MKQGYSSGPGDSRAADAKTAVIQTASAEGPCRIADILLGAPSQVSARRSPQTGCRRGWGGGVGSGGGRHSLDSAIAEKRARLRLTRTDQDKGTYDAADFNKNYRIESRNTLKRVANDAFLAD